MKKKHFNIAFAVMLVLVSIALVLGVITLMVKTDQRGTQTDPSASTTALPSGSTAAPPQTIIVPELPTLETTEETTVATTVETTEATTVPETTAGGNYSIGLRAAELAKEQLGKPYVYGTEGPDSFDASGLLQYIYGELDISVPRSVKDQAAFGTEVDREDVQPGDAVFFYSDTPGTAQSVGIYVGDGIFIAAFNSSKPVMEQKFFGDYFTERFVCVRRFYNS